MGLASYRFSQKRAVCDHASIENRRLEALPELNGHAAAKALSEVAMLWQDNPSKLRELRPLVAPMLERALSAAGDTGTPALPDALAAAHATIATVLIYQRPR